MATSPICRNAGHIPPPAPCGNYIFFLSLRAQTLFGGPSFFSSFPLSPFSGIRQPGKNSPFIVCCLWSNPIPWSTFWSLEVSLFSFFLFFGSVLCSGSDLWLQVLSPALGRALLPPAVVSCWRHWVSQCRASRLTRTWISMLGLCRMFFLLSNRFFYACAIADLPIRLDRSSMLQETD